MTDELAPLPTRYIVQSKVLKVVELTIKTYVSGVGPEARFKEKSLGWYLYLEGSYEAIHMGSSKPEFEAGDRVKITFEKVQA
jgi:hypothetical protein